MITSVVFDLDGTLLDTLDDLGDSMNQVLAEMACPIHEIDAYRYFVGNGIRMLAQRALPEDRRDDATVTAAVEAMQREYAGRWHAKTRPYDGVMDLLEELTRHGVPLAVLSNKPDVFVKKAVDHYFAPSLFRSVYGALDGVPRKPDPTLALRVAGELGLPADQACLLGDSGSDMQTAKRAGMLPVGVRWGFRDASELERNGAAHLLEKPKDLLSLLGERSSGR